MRPPDELVPWLREQIAADRRVASEVSSRATQLQPGEADVGLYVIDDDYRHNQISISGDEVLARCTAYERVLDFAEGMALPNDALGALPDQIQLLVPQLKAMGDVAASHLVALVALAFEHRPDYREEWRP